MKIKYLANEEKAASRALWEECFPEDSQSFVDYYYEEKVKENRILVCQEEGVITSMLHRNPYKVKVRSLVWETDYIVAVATARAYRHQGRMRLLINQMVSDMYREKMPFCFLMPAAEVIYRPFQFTYIYDQPSWKLKEAVGEKVMALGGSGSPETYKKAAKRINRLLDSQYEVYCIRDESYLENLQKEVRSDGGEVYLIPGDELESGGREVDGINDESQICGICALTGESQRTLICPEEYREKSGAAKPAIMGRIIHLQTFVKSICLKMESRFEMLDLILELDDPLIPENTGCFLWKLTKGGSVIRPLISEEYPGSGIGEEAVGLNTTQAVIKTGIEQLTAWLFGYECPEGGFQDEICTLNGIFLDEVV